MKKAIILLSLVVSLGLFNVVFQFKIERGGESVLQQHRGPASAKASLHLLKWVYKGSK